MVSSKDMKRSANMFDLVKEIRRLLDEGQAFKITKISRSQNSVSRTLANVARRAGKTACSTRSVMILFLNQYKHSFFHKKEIEAVHSSNELLQEKFGESLLKTDMDNIHDQEKAGFFFCEAEN